MSDAAAIAPNPFAPSNLLYFLPFLLELVIGTLLFTRGFARRRALRRMAATAGLIAVACLHGVYRWWWQTSLRRSAKDLLGAPTVTVGEFVLQNVVFLLYALLVVLAMRQSFVISWMESLIVVAMGYSVQHVGFALIRTVQTLAGNTMYVYDLRLLPLRIVVFAVTYGAVWLVIGRRFRIDSERIRNAPRRVALAIGVLVFVVMFNFIITELINEGSLGPRGQAMCYLYDALCSMLSFVILVMASNIDRLANDLAVIRQVDTLKAQHYELNRENIELVNVTFHDVRKNLASLRRVMRQVQDSGVTLPDVPLQTLEQMERSIRVYDSIFDTGDDALDTLLTEKSLYCDSHGITLTAMADGKALSFMEHADIYALFGNILDNAIEAVALLPEADNRQITLSVAARGRLLNIEEENYYAGDVRMENGLPATTKGDRRFHGFGMRSIARQIERYHGEMTIDTADQVFSLSIVLPIPAAPATPAAPAPSTASVPADASAAPASAANIAVDSDLDAADASGIAAASVSAPADARKPTPPASDVSIDAADRQAAAERPHQPRQPAAPPVAD